MGGGIFSTSTSTSTATSNSVGEVSGGKIRPLEIRKSKKEIRFYK
jgi:hypothetical protein